MRIALAVWTLDLPEAEIARLALLLSADEIERARRFVRDRDRTRFISARGRLREILASRIGSAPAAVRLAYGENGKPRLADAKDQIHFSLSHSEDLAALAISNDCELGLDIEHVRPLKEDIAGRFFSPDEVNALEALPPEEQLAGF